MNSNNFSNYSNVEIYFGSYINENVINIDISKKFHEISKFLSNFDVVKTQKCKTYIYNNLYYECQNNKHICYKKNNLVSKEFKINNVTVKLFAFNKKVLSNEIFPAVKEYYNEEEYQETIYSNGICVKSGNDWKIIYLNKFNTHLINAITKLF